MRLSLGQGSRKEPCNSGRNVKAGLFLSYGARIHYANMGMGNAARGASDSLSG